MKKVRKKEVARPRQPRPPEVITPAAPAAPPRVSYVPRNRSQRLAAAAFSRCDVLFLTGGAGGGKTCCAVGLALGHAVPLAQQVAVCRPAVEASAGLGFAKGTLDEKYGPWAAPVIDNAEKLVKGARRHLDFQPLAYLRGKTFDGVAILDEAQNCTRGEILLFLTRLGQGGKLLISGDPDQSDVAASGLLEWISCLGGVPGIACIDFPPDQNLRHPLVQEIIRRQPR